MRHLGYTRYTITPRLQYFRPNTSRIVKGFAQEISSSLGADSKFISPKFFYDARGSEIFEQICTLSEYYLTRTEITLLHDVKQQLSSLIHDSYRLVELGSGSAVKTRLLLDALISSDFKLEYFPIDISEILKQSSQKLLDDYSNLYITGIIDTYCSGLQFLGEYDKKPNLIAFLGSSFGNFEANDGKEFLKTVNLAMKDSDFLLIGFDLLKSEKILISAYDDSKKITAKFNLNVLHRINQELDGNFDLDKFSHKAIFNKEKQRIEMYLCSKEKQSVKIPKADLVVNFDKDECIHTEHSHKFTIPQIESLLNQTLFNIVKIWQDKENGYALVLTSKLNVACASKS